jgi:glycerol-3-phosphate acyltransferase PlsY
MTPIHFIIIAVVAYLLGSLSSSIIVCKLTTGEDIRTYGSGNAGLTNSYRTLGAKKDRPRAAGRCCEGRHIGRDRRDAGRAVW